MNVINELFFGAIVTDTHLIMTLDDSHSLYDTQISFGLLLAIWFVSTTTNSIFDEMPCKLKTTENPRSFEKYPTPP